MAVILNFKLMIFTESANNVRQFYTHYGADVNLYNMNAEHCMVMLTVFIKIIIEFVEFDDVDEFGKRQ